MHRRRIPTVGQVRPKSLSESSQSEEEDNSSTVHKKISNQSLMETISREFSVNSPIYHDYYSLPNSSYCHYKTVFPDVSEFTFEDSESEFEDSDVSSADENDLAMKVRILETKFDIMFRQQNREREEMMRLHQAMVKLVTDLIKVVSPPTSPLWSSNSPLKQEATTRPSLHSTKEEPLHSTRKEPLHVATKEVHSHTRQFEDVRKQQQLQIDKMVAYIDERAAYYIKNRPTLPKEPYPWVDWSRINRHIRSLPQPSQLPVYGCPQYPHIYPDCPDPKGRVMSGNTITECYLPECEHTDCHPPANSTTTICKDGSLISGGFTAITRDEDGKILLSKVYHPLQATEPSFGKAAGFETNHGIVAPPTSPVSGYIYTENG